ncbi:hypothetical protein CYLTODRAFT_45745 [Cylindrobasidium torrendii FP15055 ss-10]|uniref:Uncharacterized protein n=1 Tax=Cylindrobasidium torrendii FP15055 ss-10 TaxID=1314674 RepID=A0A0D7BP75_9AGAR|nr:hypothetical protein CYLTODRAFT_45745 [Cylindrobasidium torrendii FP15055 ss-10]
MEVQPRRVTNPGLSRRLPSPMEDDDDDEPKARQESSEEEESDESSRPGPTPRAPLPSSSKATTMPVTTAPAQTAQTQADQTRTAQASTASASPTPVSVPTPEPAITGPTTPAAPSARTILRPPVGFASPSTTTSTAKPNKGKAPAQPKKNKKGTDTNEGPRFLPGQEPEPSKKRPGRPRKNKVVDKNFQMSVGRWRLGDQPITAPTPTRGVASGSGASRTSEFPPRPSSTESAMDATAIEDAAYVPISASFYERQAPAPAPELPTIPAPLPQPPPPEVPTHYRRDYANGTDLGIRMETGQSRRATSRPPQPPGPPPPQTTSFRVPTLNPYMSVIGPAPTQSNVNNAHKNGEGSGWNPRPSGSGLVVKPKAAREPSPYPVRLLTIYIHDVRSGVSDKQLVEIKVPLAPVEEPADGFRVDSLDLCEALQSGPWRIDGPAKVYTLRGKFRQFFLRITEQNHDEAMSCELCVSSVRAIDIVVEMVGL